MGEAQSSPEFSAGKTSLRRAIEFISSLISLSHSIKVFSVKWQSIRNKLEELNSGLTAVENSDSGENPAISGVINDMMITADTCHELGRQCFDHSYSGKLLMQSDLDVMGSKFDTHLKDLTAIYSAGVLNYGYAIVVSRPGFGACKDDMKFYVKDLMTRMKIGDLEMKKQALVFLNEILIEDDKYVKIVVESNELIHLLVGFLDCVEIEIQEESSKAISVISGFDLGKFMLIEIGVLGPLIRVLEFGNDLGKEASARSLRKLTENSDNAWAISAHGGVTTLLRICSNDDSRGELIGFCCGVLKNLCGVVEIKRFMLEEGVISLFVSLVRSKDEVVVMNSMEFIDKLSIGDESIRQLIVKEGGIRALVGVLDPNVSISLKTIEISLRAIENLCFGSSSLIDVLMGLGFMEKLLFFLRNGEVSAQELALKSAFRLSEKSEDVKKVMGDNGFMPEFVRLLEAKSFEVRETAAEILSSMVLVHRNRRRFVQEDRNVGVILQLLDPEEGNSGNNRKFLLSTLMSLTSSNSGRRKIVSSNYLKNIEKLAQAEVSDAKRIVKKLTSNRLKNIFSGMWHS